MGSAIKLDLNLQQMAMAQVAINCWEHQEIKREINDFFLTNEYDGIYDELEGQQEEWTTKVLDIFMNEITPPDSIKHQMIHMIQSVGHRIVHWLNHKAQTPMLKYYIDNIFWTSHGTIDEVKIFEVLYTNHLITDLAYLYEEACSLYLEDYVHDLRSQLSDQQKNLINTKIDSVLSKNRGIYAKDYNICFLLYWRLPDRRSHIFTESSVPFNFKEGYNFNQSAQANNFKYSISFGYEAATKYFFEQLSDEEKNHIVGEAAEMLMHGVLRDPENQIASYESRSYYHINYINILIFLMHHMSDSQNENLVKEYSLDILQSLLFLWPGQDLIVPILKQFLSHFDDWHFKNLFDTIIRRIINEDSKFIYNLEYYRLHQILLEIWDVIPVVDKEELTEDFDLLFGLFLNILENVSFLKCVVHHPDVTSKRKELLKKIESHFYKLLINNKHNVVEQILKEVFLYTEEQCDNFRNTLDCSDICKTFLSKNQFWYLRCFLEWRFEDNDELYNFMNGAKFNLCTSVLCSVWKSKEVEFCQRMNEQLFSYFKYDESDKRYWRQQLLNSDDFKLTVAHIAEKGPSKKFNTFLNSCGFSRGEITQLRQQFPIHRVATASPNHTKRNLHL